MKPRLNQLNLIYIDHTAFYDFLSLDNWGRGDFRYLGCI